MASKPVIKRLHENKGDKSCRAEEPNLCFEDAKAQLVNGYYHADTSVYSKIEES